MPYQITVNVETEEAQEAILALFEDAEQEGLLEFPITVKTDYVKE